MNRRASCLLLLAALLWLGCSSAFAIRPHPLQTRVGDRVVNLPASVNLLYDNDGNLTNDGARGLACDAENELTNITVVGNWKSDFVYDGLNRRRIERDFSWNAGTSSWVMTNEVHYVYDGYLLLQERNSGPEEELDQEVLQAESQMLRRPKQCPLPVQQQQGKPVMTPWGWQGSPPWLKARNVVGNAGNNTTFDVKDLGLDIRPTLQDARDIIDAAGGTIVREDIAGHAPGGVSTHIDPHVNYTTASGNRATIYIRP